MRVQVVPGWARNVPSTSRFRGAMTTPIRQGAGSELGHIFGPGRFSVGRWREGQRKTEILNFWKSARAGVDASGAAGVCEIFILREWLFCWAV